MNALSRLSHPVEREGEKHILRAAYLRARGPVVSAIRRDGREGGGSRPREARRGRGDTPRETSGLSELLAWEESERWRRALAGTQEPKKGADERLSEDRRGLARNRVENVVAMASGADP